MLVPALIDATKLDPGGDALHRRAALEVLASLVPWWSDHPPILNVFFIKDVVSGEKMAKIRLWEFRK